MEQLNEPTAAQTFLSRFLTTIDYQLVMRQLPKIFRQKNYYSQVYKLMELEILYSTLNSKDDYQKKEEIIDHLLSLTITNRKETFIEKGKLIAWTLLNLCDSDYILRVDLITDKIMRKKNLGDLIFGLIFIKDPPPTNLDFDDAVAICQRLQQIFKRESRFHLNPIWEKLMRDANKHFSKFGNFEKAVDSDPKTYNPNIYLALHQQNYISQSRQALNIRRQELIVARMKKREKIRADLEAREAEKEANKVAKAEREAAQNKRKAAEKQRKAAEVARREKQRRAYTKTVFEWDPDFFAIFKKLIEFPLNTMKKSLWMSDLHSLLKKWENVGKNWEMNQLFYEMFQYFENSIKTERKLKPENEINVNFSFLRICVEFLSFPTLRYEDVSNTFHTRFKRLLHQVSEKLPQQAQLYKEIRILYTSLGYNFEDENSTKPNICNNIFYKIPVCISSFTAIKQELIKFPKDAQRQKISGLIYIYRKSPEKDLQKLLEILVSNETKITNEAAKSLLWAFVELLDNRNQVSSVDVLAPLFLQSIPPNCTQTLFNELVSIRQELAFKLPDSTDFSKIDNIFSGSQIGDWASAIISVTRKPGMHYYINFSYVEEKKIEIIQAFLKQSLAHDLPPQSKEVNNAGTEEEVNTPKISSDIDKGHKLQSNPSNTVIDSIHKGEKRRNSTESVPETIKAKKTLSSQEMEQIKQKMIGVGQSIPNSSSSSQFKINNSNGESSNSWLTSIIPSKDSIISNSKAVPETQIPIELVQTSEGHTGGKVFAEIKKKIIKSQTSLKGSSSRIVGDKMEVILTEDFITEEYLDQILSPSFVGQSSQIVDGKLSIIITHSLNYQENKRKLNVNTVEQ